MYLLKSTPLFALALACVSLGFSGCDKDDDDKGNMYNLSGSLNGAAEKPNAVTTPATGTLTGTYDADNNILNYTVNWVSLKDSATAAHFHGPATADQSAPPVKDIVLTNKGTTSSTTGTITTITEAEEADLLGGKWYVNVHSKAHGPGEIRAQVITTRQ